MEFGKVTDLSLIDFALPQIAVSDLWLEKYGSKKEQTFEVFVGCTGWSMKEWVGSIYPKGTKSKDYLKAYSAQFNTIEHNTTHYQIPSVATVEKWYHESAKDFVFCPKLPQVISHSKDFGESREATLQFCTQISLLDEKLGPCFMQLPPYFGLDRWDLLRGYVSRFPKGIPLAIEFRHASWFQSNAMDLWVPWMTYHGWITVITDVAGRRDVSHGQLTSNQVLVRFVGNDLDTTDYHRIQNWINCLEKWQKQGLKKVYFFTHEPDNLKAPELAKYLVEQIHEKHPSWNVKSPTWGTPPFPKEGIQGTLF